MYRYRLSNNKVNGGHDSRSIKGTAVFRNRWLYSDNKLFEEPDLQKLIIEEEAKNKEEFFKIDKEKKLRNQIESARKELKDTNVDSLSMQEIVAYCYRLGFPPEEIEGEEKQYLLSLIDLDLLLEE